VVTGVGRSGRARIGVKAPNWGSLASSDHLSSTARLAEQRGFDSIWVSDHVVMPTELNSPYPFRPDGKPPFDPRTPFQDPFVALAFMAAVTRHVELGIGVLVLPMRQPILVAKQAATLDVLSGGRAILGVGTGWMREEFELLGQDFTTRGRRTDDAIAIMRACWRDDPIDLGDDARQLGPVAMAPKPVGGRGLRVWVGGHSPAALGRAARIGDGWYGSNVLPYDYRRLATEVRRLRDEHHGPGDAFTLGIKVPVCDPADALELRDGYEQAGADVIVFDMDMEFISHQAACDVIEGTADVLGLEAREEP
jgi:probable F420-dependent oxidoreductase